MRVSLKWLSEYVDLAVSPTELADLLTMAGLQVELIEKAGADCTGVIAGFVEKKEKHPNADKLSLCRVSTGTATVQVVCGAPNVEQGRVYPFAPIGAVLPGDFKIKRAKLRGVESEGMLCSERELGLSQDAEGLMDLPLDTRPGTPIEQIVGAPDTVLELSITPNRPDCLGLLGIAREVAALTGKALRPPETGPLQQDAPIGDLLNVELEAAGGCPRYSARVVRGVKVGPSPDWMQRYLKAAGLRPINNVVDITNFVMLERGHPMHAFDARYLHGSRIVIRWASDGEKLTTLDGTDLTLTREDLVIADAERGVALAGIMGGLNSEIRQDTTDVVLEAAYFDPVSIRKSSRRLKIHTDSSHRFERGCDPSATLDVLDRAALLLQRHASGRNAAGRIDCYPMPIEPRSVALRSEKVNRLLGTDLDAGRMADLLRKLELLSAPTGDGLQVRVPTFRPDIETETDLAEELARLHGYGNIPQEPPLMRALPIEETPVQRAIRAMRDALTGAGVSEAVSLAFAPPLLSSGAPSLTLANPLGEESARMRGNLVDGLVTALGFNLSRQATAPWLFEIGRIFQPATSDGRETPFAYSGLPIQPYHVGFLLAGAAGADWRHGQRPVDFHTAKGLVEALGARMKLDLSVRPELPAGVQLPAVAHPSRRAGVFHGETYLGYVAEISPEVPFLKRFQVPCVLGELDLERLALLERPIEKTRPLPAFPRAQRDLAFLLPEAARYEAIETTIRASGAEHLEAVSLFDVFTGKSLPAGKKSMAFSLSFRHPERTLTDQEVEQSVARIVEQVRALGGELR